MGASTKVALLVNLGERVEDLHLLSVQSHTGISKSACEALAGVERTGMRYQEAELRRLEGELRLRLE